MSEKETFESFRKSLFYGSRSDLSFKFIDHMSDEEGSAFLQQLFHSIIDGFDTREPDLIKKTIIEGQTTAYNYQSHFAYDEGPFTPMAKDLKEAKLCLITSSGHFVKGDDPSPLGTQNMNQQEAERRIMEFIKEEPKLSEIPFSTPPENLVVRHGGYDVKASLIDANVSFPWQRMKEIVGKTIGSLTENAYSFVGACSQKRLINTILPQWVEKIHDTGVDGVILVPV